MATGGSGCSRRACRLFPPAGRVPAGCLGAPSEQHHPSGDHEEKNIPPNEDGGDARHLLPTYSKVVRHVMLLWLVTDSVPHVYDHRKRACLAGGCSTMARAADPGPSPLPLWARCDLSHS